MIIIILFALFLEFKENAHTSTCKLSHYVGYHEGINMDSI